MFLFARCLHLLVIREWRCQDIDQVLLHGRCFLSSASSSTEVGGQNRSPALTFILKLLVIIIIIVEVVIKIVIIII